MTPGRGAVRLLAATLAAVLCSACTGSSRDKEATPPPAGPEAAAAAPSTTAPGDGRLTRDEYIRQGDALCAAWNEKNDAAPAPEGASGAERARTAQYVLSTIDRPFVTQFTALPAPAADKVAVERLHTALEEYVKKSQELVTALRAGRDVEKLDADLEAVHRRFHVLAGKYGFLACAADAGEGAALGRGAER